MSFFSAFTKKLKTVDTYSSVATGLEFVALQAEDYQGLIQKTEQRTVLHRDVEKVTNIDETTIEFVLKSENGKIVPQAGYLIEIYSSGSDGRLLRLYQSDLTDLHGKVLLEGFSNFMTLEIDR